MTKPRKEAFAVMNQGMMGFVTANNEWYPGGLQISLHIDLPDF